MLLCAEMSREKGTWEIANGFLKKKNVMRRRQDGREAF